LETYVLQTKRKIIQRNRHLEEKTSEASNPNSQGETKNSLAINKKGRLSRRQVVDYIEKIEEKYEAELNRMQEQILSYEHYINISGNSLDRSAYSYDHVASDSARSLNSFNDEDQSINGYHKEDIDVARSQRESVINSTASKRQGGYRYDHDASDNARSQNFFNDVDHAVNGYPHVDIDTDRSQPASIINSTASKRQGGYRYDHDASDNAGSQHCVNSYYHGGINVGVLARQGSF